MVQNGTLAPVVTLLVTELWKPVKKHMGYCLKPETSVRNLAKSVDELKDSIDNTEETIQLGKCEGKEPKVPVRRWIESARSIEAEACRIRNKYESRTIHIFGCSWSCWFNYKISKSAAKVKDGIEDINKRSPQKDDILSLLRPIGMEFPLPNNIVGQEDYRSKVFGCIEEGATNISGICGMGGSGKSTLLKQINNYFYTSERHGFEHVMFIEVGKQLNLMAVQKNIASALGLMLTNDGDVTHNAIAIFNFLKEKKFLLLIDDLWDMLDPVKVGIPQGSNKCCRPNRQIVVITTRSRDICGKMHISEENVTQLKFLNSYHSWQLFKDIVGGRNMEDAPIRGFAEKIAAKCGGIPLAIKIIGQAMASKVTWEEWEYNLKLLEDSVFQQISGSDNELFPILKISYDSLQSDVRKCFLLFAGFAPEDPDDDWEPARLVKYWMGHGLLGDNDDIERTYLRGHSIIEILKRSFLIESSDFGEKHVKMHHVLQDMALWIVATKQNGRHKEKWLVHQREHTQPDVWSTADRVFLFGDDIKIIPSSCGCPDLLTLILVKSKHISEFPAGFFSTMKSLIYLDLSETRIQEIPSEIGSLTSLQSLDLSSTPIHSLPVELGLLENLRYLLLACTNLRNIPNGLLSRLKMLRLLGLYRCYNLRIDSSEGYMEELESLTRLRDVSFTVQDSESLEKIYNLHTAFVSRLCIIAPEGLQFLQISPKLLTSSKASHMKALSLDRINLLEELVIGQPDMDPGWCLPMLDTLLLQSLLALQRVEFKGTRSNTCLSGLRNISISHCDNLMSVTWITWLPCLEKAYLGNCDSIVELVANNEAVLPATSSFPRLRFLGLCNLKNMHSISICDGRITFPSLMGLLVYGCPMLTKLPRNLAGAESSLHIFGERKWWESIEWEGASSQSSPLPFFREIPADFRGDPQEALRLLRVYSNSKPQ